MWIKIQDCKFHVIIYSVLLFVQIFLLILVNAENVTDTNQSKDGPNITYKSYPFQVEFYIDNSSYTIKEVNCRTDELLLTSDANNCKKLEPCSTYIADLEIENINNPNDIFKRTIKVKTEYEEPKVKLTDTITTPFSIYIEWGVTYPSCINIFHINVTSDDKNYYYNIKTNNVTFPNLSPCQTYFIDIVTIDINNKIIEPNITKLVETKFADPGSVTSLTFLPKSAKSVQVSWKTPNYISCIHFYEIKWKKENCSIQNESFVNGKCKWEYFTINNPKTTDYIIDNLEGCEKYQIIILTSGLDRNSITDTFTAPEQQPGPITSFETVNNSETNMTIKWKLPNENGRCVSSYKVHIIGPLQNIYLNETIETNARKLYFDELKPCGMYNITITAISYGNLTSAKVENTIKMIYAKPNPIQNLNVKYYYPHEIILEWKKPNYSELCVDLYRISGWSNDDINNTEYQFSSQTNRTNIQISNLVSCMTYIVQIIPVIIGSEPSFDGNPTQLKVETIATSSAKPAINDPTPTSHSLLIRAINNDEKNICPILIAKFECFAKDAGIKYAEKIVEGDMVRTFLATLEPLSPFTTYNCEVYFYNTGGKSLKSNLVWSTDKYYPEEPTDLKAIYGNNSLYINWNKPIYLNGDLVFYKIFIQNVGPQYKIPLHCNSPAKQNIFYEHSKSDFEYKELQPYNQYSIQVAAKNDFGTGKLTNPFVITSQPSISNPIENFKLISIDGPEISDNYNATVLLQWQPPCKSNGIIKLFELDFYGTRNGFNNHYFIRYITSDQIPESSYFINWKESNLKPEYNYTVSVKVSIVGVEEKSRPISINFISPAGIPDILNNTNTGKVDAFLSTKPTTSALVKIPIDTFRSNMGKIIYAAVLLSEIGCQDDPQLISGKLDIDKDWPNISSWQQVKFEKCTSQYQTTPERWQPFIKQKSSQYKIIDSFVNSDSNFNDIIEYVIGNENDCNIEKTYCNGPLKANTQYKMILRIFTRNGFADTVSLEFKTDEEVQIYVIMLMVIGVLLIAFFLGFIYMWINKRKIWYRQSLNGIEDQCGDVTTRNYLVYYQDLSKKDKILREFKELDVVSNDTNSKNIITRYNDLKNRYSNIFPYENNRVILDSDSDGSDYINASFINGYKRKKEYIATQGPKPESFIDFWKMIIQHNCKIIIMLTQLREGNIVKCHQYYPIMSREMKIGNNITVCCRREIENDIYERRDMIIKHSGDHIYRNIVHYYFKKWPDHDCPSDVMDLITFVKRVKTEKIPNRSPIVVHCSAGVGRTGTFIGLDIIMQRMKNEGKINIYETIKQLRFERMKMVQTIQQYQFLYNCIYQLVLNKYSTSDSKKNSLITNNSSTIITPPATPLSPTITPFSSVTQLSPPIFISSNCNGKKKDELIVANNHQNNNSDTISSRNSCFSPNDIESVM